MMSGQAENVAIVTQQLTKSYGKVKALQGVDLTVYRGEIFGFLGPNGAGKTTTIRCLMDLIRPDNGTISIMGHDPQVNPVVVKTNSGYLPGELHLNANLTAEKQLRYFNDLRGGQAEWSFIRQLADRLDLDLKRPIKNLSKGNKHNRLLQLSCDERGGSHRRTGGHHSPGQDRGSRRNGRPDGTVAGTGHCAFPKAR